MTEEEYWLTHGEYKGKNNPKAIKNKKKRTSTKTSNNGLVKGGTNVSLKNGKNGKNGKKNDDTDDTGGGFSKYSEALSEGSKLADKLSKMSASPNLAGDGAIQFQGGPEKVAFRSDQYDKEAQRILKKLGNPYE